MGFLDKLKNAGENVLKGALTMAATSYGMVTSGKHNMCKVCMNSEHNKLSFIKVAVVDGEYVIKDSIKKLQLNSEDASRDYHAIDIYYADGEEKTTIVLNVEKNQDGAVVVTPQRRAAQYRNPAVLVSSLARNVEDIDDDTKNWVNKIMRFAGQKEIF